MDDAGKAVLIIFLVLVFILFCLWLRCCYLERRLVSPLEKIPLLYARLTTGRRELLLKRCAQSSTKKIEDAIIARLEQDSSVSIVEKPWDRVQDDERKPVLVFCVISSRIGTDIENAMSGIYGNSPVVLVLLHCKLSSLLRGDLSDEEELLDTSLKNRMTGIAHFAFSDSEGLYNCRQNEIGFGKMNSLAMTVGLLK